MLRIGTCSFAVLVMWLWLTVTLTDAPSGNINMGCGWAGSSCLRAFRRSISETMPSSSSARSIAFRGHVAAPIAGLLARGCRRHSQWGESWGDSPSRRAYPHRTAHRLKTFSVQCWTAVDVCGYLVDYT